jgi:adenylate cyclase
MAGISERAAREQRTMGPLVVLAVVLGLIGLPIAVWLDLRDLSERMLRAQASEISRIIDDMRGFYGSDVVGRVLQADGVVTTTHNYRDIPGAIPIPATLSIELGKRISAHDGSVKYRFVSDLPFKGREPHSLDAFEKDAIAALRQDPKLPIVDKRRPGRHLSGLHRLPERAGLGEPRQVPARRRSLQWPARRADWLSRDARR